MAHGNGKKPGDFLVGGPLVADGSMIVQVRLAPAPGSTPDKSNWTFALLTTNAVRGNQPPDQRSRLMLSAKDATVFGVPPGQAAKRNIQVLGLESGLLDMPVVCVVGNGDFSVLGIDTLAGVLNIDGVEGTWSWTVKR